MGKTVAINEDLPSCKLTVRCGKSTLTVDHFPAVYGIIVGNSLDNGRSGDVR